MVNTIRFRSTLFNTSLPEAHFVNPCCYGDDVAQWLAAALRGRGYMVAGPDQEDWGWYLEVGGRVQRTLNIGWIEDDLIWQIVIEPRFSLKRLFFRREADDWQLLKDIEEIVRSVPENVIDEWLHLDRRGSETEQSPALPAANT